MLSLPPAVALVLAISASAGCQTELGEEEWETETLEAVCERAEGAAQSCLGDQAVLFEECIAMDDTESHRAAMAALADSSCNAPDSELEDSPKMRFVSACAMAVESARLLSRLRHGSGSALGTTRKQLLRPFYGSLVDRVRIHYDARPITEWRVLGRTIRVGMEVGGQALGYDVYVMRPKNLSDSDQTETVAHELQHVAQFEEAGVSWGFAVRYCGALWDSDFSYRSNALEVEARDQAEAIASCLESPGSCD